MEITAKTSKGYLIQASEKEIKEMLQSIFDGSPGKIEIGSKIPIIEYTETIAAIKKIEHDFDYLLMMSRIDKFVKGTRLVRNAAKRAFDLSVKRPVLSKKEIL